MNVRELIERLEDLAEEWGDHIFVERPDGMLITEVHLLEDPNGDAEAFRVI